MLSKLRYDEPLSKFALNSNLRRYEVAPCEEMVAALGKFRREVGHCRYPSPRHRYTCLESKLWRYAEFPISKSPTYKLE
jgi:hypothetical protein